MVGIQLPTPPRDISVHMMFRSVTEMLFSRAVAPHPDRFVNDPTAGSPTVTLLRLLLPLNDQV